MHVETGKQQATSNNEYEVTVVADAIVAQMDALVGVAPVAVAVVVVVVVAVVVVFRPMK